MAGGELYDEILARLRGLPPEKLADLQKTLPKYRFVPNPGPQTDAYFSKADLLLYGGQAGGGKSGLILGLALNEHKRTLIMRRRYADLSGLTDDLIKIYGKRDGFASAPRPKLRTDDGRVVEFGAAQHIGDEQSHQGQPHDLLCVGKDTQVLMSDGMYMAIQDVSIGDMVMTLEGPRRVNRVIPVRRDRAVRLFCYDAENNQFSTQVQSYSHKLLTSAGWVSRDSGVGSRASSSFASTVFRAASRFLGLTILYTLAYLQSSARNSFHRQHTSSLPQRFSCQTYQSGFSVSLEQGLMESGSLMSGDSSRGIQRLALSSAQQARLQPFSRLKSFLFFRSSSSCGVSGVRKMSSLADWMVYYLSCLRQYGERTLASLGLYLCKEGGQLYLHQQGDAGQQTPSYSALGGRGKTHKHNQTRCIEYDHPYTMEKRQTEERIASFPFAYSDAGVVYLYDIEVDEVNHYITRGGIVNKNCFDEAVHFAESQVRFLMGWVRSTEPGQRCRVVMASNPPVGSQGDWVVKMFAPWLDPAHPNPARAGELRWYVSGDDDQDIEVPDATPYVVGERILIPQSRTFIPAKLTDNPFLANTDYQSKLDALPEPLRSALRDGNFMAARRDQDMQVIPTSWARAAVARWQSRPPQAIPMCGIGVDCGGGGKDPTIIAYRHDGWYAPLVEMSPRDTPDGTNIGGKVLSVRRDNAAVVVDAGGGYGNLPMRELRENGIAVTAYKGAEAATGRTADGQFGFVNKRSQVIWRFREALDPTQPGGSPIMLPDDPILISDLTAPTFEYTPRGIKVESKEDVVKKIGRSTDRGDSVCLAWSSGARMASDGRTWLANRARLGNNSVTVFTSRDKKKDRG